MKRWIVRLESEERARLEQLVRVGKAAGYKIRHANELLAVDEADTGPGLKDEQVAQALGISIRTIESLRRRFVESGLEACLIRKEQTTPRIARIFDGEKEAKLIALACGLPPKGRVRWTLELLADRVVALRIVDACSPATVQRVLKKNVLKPWRKRMWCIPPEQNAEFVCAMENVLEVYTRPYDAKRPVVCLDEKSKQLVGEICKPIAARPGRTARCDYEYVRNGTANLFMMVEPLCGWRSVYVTTRRTKMEFAQQVKQLVDVHYTEAERITLVMENLNTHRLSTLYEAFEPAEARRLIERIEVVHTPKHGSWLNMAECELSVLEVQALAERIGNESDLTKRVTLWSEDRNRRTKRIDWQFRTADARVKLL
jgi:transposase